MFTKQSEDKILSWIKDDQISALGSYLLSGTVHGKPGLPVAELERVEKILKKKLSDQEQYRLGKKLLKRPEHTARNIGTHLVIVGWPTHKDVASQLKKAADDEDWIVREYAAGAFASLLRQPRGLFRKKQRGY